MINGIDISNWQGAVDFAQVKAQGYEVAYIKATEGEHTLDAFCSSHYQNAKANGMKIGFYHFLQGDEDGTAQANFMYSVIKNYDYDCKIAIDVETTNGASPTQLSQVVCNFATQIKNLTGNDVVIYTYSSFGSNLDNTVSAYPLWIANYGANQPTLPSQWSSYIGWQYSQSGEVNGCPAGNTDLDYFTNDIFLQTSSTANVTFTVGENVKVTGSTYATGQNIPSWVQGNIYPITQVGSGEVLLGAGLDSWVNNSGVEVVTGWQKVSNIWYYYNNQGVMQTGWQKISNIWYYLQSNGSMVTGLNTIEGKQYYFNPSGAMQTGTINVNGTTMTFNSSGAYVPPAPVVKPSTPTNFIVGEKVTVVAQNYATGQAIPDWVKGNPYPITEINNDRVLLGGGLNSWIGISGVQAMANSVVIGDMVKVTGSTYATGQSIPMWVKQGTYPITQVGNGQCLLGGGLDSWVSNNDLVIA